MAEYVSKETLQEKLNRKKAGPATKRYTEGWNDAILMVKSMIHSDKAADVAPVRHGRWIRPHWRNSDYCCDCSECGGEAMHREYKWNEKDIYHICPNCGAKMDGGNDD